MELKSMFSQPLFLLSSLLFSIIFCICFKGPPAITASRPISPGCNVKKLKSTSPPLKGGEDSSTVNRRQPLLRTTTTATPMTTKNIESPHRRRAGEVAGRTAAECATVCCCFPCAVVHFLVLAVYKVPTGLCRKMWRKEKRKKLLNNNKKKNEPKGAYDNVANEKKCGSGVGSGGGGGKPVVAESETEMWGRLYEGGFFRTASKKKED